MKRAACFFCGLALLALGILGMTDVVPAFKSSDLWVNIAEIVLGAFGFLAGFARKG
ncbi:MAG: hypothetical protein Q8O09_01035 [Bacillota bacterium]|nr:hypothetical protein [Bacillota bacterium]